MTPLVPRRPDLARLEGYHSPQVAARVRLNTNESPYPPPEPFTAELVQALGNLPLNRYPDRGAVRLREAIARYHGVDAASVFCANGSNEALQCLLLAFGGPTRRVVTFEPTYALHGHIALLAGTEVVSGGRGPDFRVDPCELDTCLAAHDPVLTFLCSPNNPTGRSEEPSLVRRAVERAPGLVVVDEAYGQFSLWSALELRGGRSRVGNAEDANRTDKGPSADREGTGTPLGDPRRLVVVRTFSKTWAMAGVRLGYLVADPEVVAACEMASLPYHLSTLTQTAGVLALKYQAEMEARVAMVTEQRGALVAGLADLAVEYWPSDANFLLFRPRERPAGAVWRDLLDRSVLVRDCSGWAGLDGCLRVTVGTPSENGTFLEALEESLR